MYRTETLDLTWRQQELGQLHTLQTVVMERFKDLGFDVDQLAAWATRMLREIGEKKAIECRALEGLHPELLEFIGLSILKFPKWNLGPFDSSILGPTRKRGAYINLNPIHKRAMVEEIEARDSFFEHTTEEVNVRQEAQGM